MPCYSDSFIEWQNLFLSIRKNALRSVKESCSANVWDTQQRIFQITGKRKFIKQIFYNIYIQNTSQRLIQFAIPKIQFVGQNSRLLSCTPLAGISSQFQNLNSDNSSSNFMLFIDILNEMLKSENGGNTPISPLALVENYYSRLAEQR